MKIAKQWDHLLCKIKLHKYNFSLCHFIGWLWLTMKRVLNFKHLSVCVCKKRYQQHLSLIQDTGKKYGNLFNSHLHYHQCVQLLVVCVKTISILWIYCSGAMHNEYTYRAVQFDGVDFTRKCVTLKSAEDKIHYFFHGTALNTLSLSLPENIFNLRLCSITSNICLCCQTSKH